MSPTKAITKAERARLRELERKTTRTSEENAELRELCYKPTKQNIKFFRTKVLPSQRRK